MTFLQRLYESIKTREIPLPIQDFFFQLAVTLSVFFSAMMLYGTIYIFYAISTYNAPDITAFQILLPALLVSAFILTWTAYVKRRTLLFIIAVSIPTITLMILFIMADSVLAYLLFFLPPLTNVLVNLSKISPIIKISISIIIAISCSIGVLFIVPWILYIFLGIGILSSTLYYIFLLHKRNLSKSLENNQGKNHDFEDA